MRYLTRMVIPLMILATATGLRADEASAVKAVEMLDGKLTRDDDAPGKPVVTVELTGSKVTDDVLKELKDLKQLQTLGLGATGVTDAGLKELKSLKQLHTLILLGTDVTDAGLKELKDLKQLKTLVLSKTKVTDAGITDLKKNLPDLVVTTAD
jgi:hypothetical protein